MPYILRSRPRQQQPVQLVQHSGQPVARVQRGVIIVTPANRPQKRQKRQRKGCIVSLCLLFGLALALFVFAQCEGSYRPVAAGEREAIIQLTETLLTCGADSARCQAAVGELHTLYLQSPPEKRLVMARYVENKLGWNVFIGLESIKNNIVIE